MNIRVELGQQRLMAAAAAVGTMEQGQQVRFPTHQQRRHLLLLLLRGEAMRRSYLRRHSRLPIFLQLTAQALLVLPAMTTDWAVQTHLHSGVAVRGRGAKHHCRQEQQQPQQLEQHQQQLQRLTVQHVLRRLQPLLPPVDAAARGVGQQRVEGQALGLVGPRSGAPVLQQARPREAPPPQPQQQHQRQHQRQQQRRQARRSTRDGPHLMSLK